MSDNLYLYTLATFRELIFSALEIAGAKKIVEVGSEHGEFTRELVAYAERNGGRLTSIDPSPRTQALEFVASHKDLPHFQFLQKPSLEALGSVDAADAFIVDGDHNYYTVHRELELISGRYGSSPWLVFLHDVCWPCARRDMYYKPSAIPPQHLKPHTFNQGIAPGNSGVVAGGLRGDGNIAFALEEGGPANGVRTAIEDFVAGRPDLKFVVVPAVLGLGIIYSQNAPWAGKLSTLLQPFVDSPLLERMERNRLQLFMKVTQLEEDLKAQSRDSVNPAPTSTAGLQAVPKVYPGKHPLEVWNAHDQPSFHQLWTRHFEPLIAGQRSLLPAESRPFTLPGYCVVCGRETTLTTDFMFASPDANGRMLPAWRERQICQCGLNCRQRSCYHLLTEVVGVKRDALVYCTEQQSVLFRQIRRAFPRAVGSEFLGNSVPLGANNRDGIRNEDITHLTFPDASLDCVFSLDVLEHVPDYLGGLSEIARCLKPGGKLLLTVPFLFGEGKTVVRAKFAADGSITHLLPPVYHGDPINPKGALCFNDFGWDLVDRIRELGFPDISVTAFTNRPFGYIGLQYIFMGTRSAVQHKDLRVTRPAPSATVPTAQSHGDGNALMQHARELFERGELWPASVAARNAVNVLPGSPEALRLLAEILLHQQNWFEAGKLFQTLARHYPADLAIWQARLECARRQKHEVHFNLVYQDALRLHPEWRSVLKPFGCVLDVSTAEINSPSPDVEGR